MADKLRFDQRYGAAPLPTQLEPTMLSDELKAKVWAVIHASIFSSQWYNRTRNQTQTGGRWIGLLYDWHVNVVHKPADEYKRDYNSTVSYARSIIYQGDFGRFYTFLEMIAENPEFGDISEQIARALIDSRAAWRFVGSEIVPIASLEQADAVVTAISTVNEQGPEGAKTHLRKSARAIAAADWAGSVRESIHAVESVARTFEGASSLGEALKSMERSGKAIHPALAKGFSALYGYSSDESGIRHSLLEKEASAVTENEALFMFGACAGFCQYLINVANG